MADYEEGPPPLDAYVAPGIDTVYRVLLRESGTVVCETNDAARAQNVAGMWRWRMRNGFDPARPSCDVCSRELHAFDLREVCDEAIVCDRCSFAAGDPGSAPSAEGVS